MYFKKLIGEKVYLSPINKNEYSKFTEWLNDMDVAIGMTFSNTLIDEEYGKDLLETLSKQPFNFAVILKENNQVIGSVGFSKLDYTNSTGEAGIFIGDKNYWKNGYGKESLELLLDFGFNILNLNNIYLRVFSFNTFAIKCYEKIGFKEAGRLREAKTILGNKYDIVYMDILSREFKSTYISSVLKRKINIE